VLSALNALASECEGSVLCVPKDVNELFILPPIVELEIGGVDLSITRPILLAVLAAVVVIVATVVAFREPARLVPGKFTMLVESGFTFVRRDIAHDIIGHGGEKFAPLLATLFFWILVMNLFEITPLVNFPPTSRLAFPLLMSLTIWFVFVITGIVKQGPIRYFVDSIIPSGVPKALLIIVVPIELISTFLVRPVSLAVRLFANLVAGHILLSLFALTTGAYITAGGVKPFLSPLPFAFQVVFTAFELLVGFLQAYIFTLLAAVYIGSSMHAEH